MEDAEREHDGELIGPASGPVTEGQIEADLERGKIYRLNDRFFKFLLGREDRKPLFLDLVNALVFPDGSAGFTGLEYANRELSAVRVEGKDCYLDIVANMADGTQVEVEVQVRNWNDYLQRSAYYLSTLHASQMSLGGSYLDLKRTVSIHILAFSLFAGERFRREFCLCDVESGEKLSDDLKLIYLEVPKCARYGTPRNRLEYWLMYLAGMEARKMPEAMVKDPMIGEALNLEKLFLQSREERQRYIVSYKAMRDAMTRDETIRRVARAEGEARGEARGLAKGIADGIATTARRMLARGVPSEQVADFTGLSPDEVEALRAGTGS